MITPNLSAKIYGTKDMREFNFGPLSESRSVPGGRQLVGHAANLTFEPACRRLQGEHSPISICIITQP